VTLLGLLTAANQTIDQLIIGARLDAEALGQYSIAYRLPELFVLHLCFLISGALFPAYAKVSGDPERLRRGYRSALRLVSLVTVPLGVGLALTAPDVVPVLFGPQWDPAVPVMQLLACTAVLRSLSFNVGDVYKAVGRVGVLNRLAVLSLVVSIPVLWLCAPSGIVAISLGLLGVSTAMTAVRLVVASKLMRVSLSRILVELWPAGCAGAGMAIAVVAAQAVFVDLSPQARLPLLVMAGALSYAGTLALISPSTVTQVTRVARGIRRGRLPAVDDAASP
jgi:PST family polysaccharide transporter